MKWCTRLVIVGLLVTHQAFADEPNVCQDAYEQSQVLMRPHEGKSSLLPAREMLRTCLRSDCKDWMVADCSKWLGEVDARIPTVVFSARDTAGRDLTDVRVTTPTGEPVGSRLDGRALEMEPGEQTFVFIAPDGTRRETRVLVREGQKAQSVTATFDAPPAPASQVRLEAPSKAAESPTSSLKLVGYGAAGVGAIGLGVGTFFGLRAVSKKDEANCDVKGECDLPALEEARSASDAATIGFITGGVLLAGGIALVLLAPSSSVRVVARAGGAGLSATW